jgi:membrane fusion protein, multidrug efflux system
METEVLQLETGFRAETTQGKAQKTDEKSVSKPTDKRKLIITGVGIVAALAVSYAVYNSYYYVSTDNAEIDAKSTYLSPRVGGIVTEVDVNENQQVKAGQVLAHIRPDEYQNALKQATAERDSVSANLKAAERSYNRATQLLKQGASTQERLDSAEAQFKSLEAKLLSLDSQLDQAKLNLADTEIKAPADGTIARKSVELGMLATAGQPIFGFVASDERWATANLKETEMKGVVPGKHASVEVDAVSGRKFDGIVESVSPSTGATFSLLPPDNATGNFTKVVQRVPVRVKLVNLSAEDIQLLQAGLSAEVTIRVH